MSHTPSREDGSQDPLSVQALPHRLRTLHDLDALRRDTFEASLQISAATPAPSAWGRFLSTVLLLVGAALTLSGLIYFFAFNWDEIGRFGKFALVGVWIVASFAIAARAGTEEIVGKVALMASSVGVGALLAVVGQTYQTGADNWELFATWAVLILPWVVVARMPGLWMLQLAIVNAAVWLSGDQLRPEWGAWNWLIMAVVNGGAWAAWTAAVRRSSWARSQWLPPILSVLTFLCLVIPAVGKALSNHGVLADGGTVAVVCLVALAAGVWGLASRGDRRDLFSTTVAATAVLVTLNTWFGRILLDDLDLDEFGLLLLSIAILLQAGAFLAWLRRLGASNQPREVSP